MSSKRTPATSKPTSDAPKTRTRAAKPAADTAAATPRAPRTRRKAEPASEVAIASETAIVVSAVATTSKPTHDQIATRAYFIALERGFSNDPLADWLAAERELTLA